MKFMFVYILKCNDGTFYTGVTNNISRRIFEHEQGMNPSCYTFSRRPVALVYDKMFVSAGEAIAFEKRLKKWSKKKKLALINGQFDTLPDLSKKRFGR